MAQDAAPGWRRFGDNNSQPAQAAPYIDPAAPQGIPQNAPQPNYRLGPVPQAPAMQGPVDLTLAAGSWITARVNEPLSSSHSQPGDAFTATLAQPIVINGLVVARTGQLVQGRVVDVARAGRVKGTSSLGVELTEIGLVDGQQVPVKTQLIQRRGDTLVGNDVGAIGVTTGLGAVIGAAAGGGWGAGIGALAGAAVGTTGVLASRGRDTVLFPEQVLTFRVESPIHVYSQASAAFQPGSPYDYNRPQMAQGPGGRQGYPYAATPYAASPYSYAAPYPYFDFNFYSRPGYFYGRGYYRRW